MSCKKQSTASTSAASYRRLGDQLDSQLSVKLVAILLPALLLCFSIGCGTIREQRATNQLLLSDAVDRAVAGINFAPLSKKKVFLDTRFLQFKNDSAVTTNYVISSLRQQMIVAGCKLQERIDDAEYVVEARVGTMGSDGHDINYGVPASSSVNAAASLVGSSPLPVLPEVSLARRTHDMAAVKIAAFAYERETREALWQSGTALAKSEATGTWFLGAGPFKQGSIYQGTEFAGKETQISRWNRLRKKAKLERHDFVYREPNIWSEELRSKAEEFDADLFRQAMPNEQIAGAQSDNKTPRVAVLPDDVRASLEAASKAAADAAADAAAAPISR